MENSDRKLLEAFVAWKMREGFQAKIDGREFEADVSRNDVDRFLASRNQRGFQPLGFCDTAVSTTAGVQRPHVKSPDCRNWRPSGLG
jgi:hypothetical protein